MAELTVTISPTTSTSDVDGIHAVVVYEREIPSADDGAAPGVAPAERILPLDPTLEGELIVDDYVADGRIDVQLVTRQGVRIVELGNLSSVSSGGRPPTFALAVRISDSQVAELRRSTSTQPPTTDQTMQRRGRFLPVGVNPPSYPDSRMIVTAVDSTALDPVLLEGLIGSQVFETRSRPLPAGSEPALAQLPTQGSVDVRVGVDGSFGFDVPISGAEDGWLWVLIGNADSDQPYLFAGAYAEPALGPSDEMRTLLLTPLPASAGPVAVSPPEGAPAQPGGQPIDVTEGELLGDPGRFSDDPGSYCRPFENPNRIVGERTFHTILRVEQPEIGGEPSVRPGFHPGLFFDPSRFDASIALRRSDTVAPIIAGGPVALAPTSTALLTSERVGVLTRASTLQKSQGRRTLSSANPLDWEGDSTSYQATSLAFGHILEHRVRWRSNGYSLGNVAHTLTLAPRQTKQILTVQSSIADSARRDEQSRSADSVSQTTQRSRRYLDSVESHLREWSRGGSRSSMTGAAGGAGFALGGFVIGGGAAHGRSSSSSWQRGGRDVSAREEQSLRDAIRQFGESLRTNESTVVVEQNQEETVQAISEVVRNPNYCHSLTVIYHEILRHLRIDTEVVSAQECVFVPMAIRQFTLDRATRWRDLLAGGMRKPALRWVMRHLKDAQRNFVGSSIPPGPRSSHPIRFLTGTLHLQLGIARPTDDDEGGFDEAAWRVLSAFTGSPIRQIYERLLRVAEARRDVLFQREEAPGISARWADTLRLRARGRELDGADFSIASSYRFNREVSIDFRYDPPAGETLTRADLEELSVQASQALPAGSVANLRRVSIRYFTDQFDHRANSPRGTDDLVSPADGAPEMATSPIPLDAPFETQDLRVEILEGVGELLEHLNEHVEYYHKLIWWNLDRDKLYMLLDGIYLRDSDGRSVASVAQHEPVAIMGNSLVFPIAAGAFVGVDGHSDLDELSDYYRDASARSEPLRVSLPTSGLYAQAIMDECNACEEHFGDTDWVLNDEDPELAQLGPAFVTSRRAESPDLSPTPFAAPIINLQNAPDAPAPSGFADILNAVQNGEAFRDMAGLAGTQANARAALEQAAGLATSFGAKAVELRKAQLATQNANRKLDTIKRARDLDLVGEADAVDHTNRALGEMNVEPRASNRLTEQPEVRTAIERGDPIRVSRTDQDGSEAVEVGYSLASGAAPGSAGAGGTGGAATGAAPQPIFIVETSGFSAQNRAFNPAARDISGVIELSVRVPQLPSGGTIRWSVPPSQPPNHRGSVRLLDSSGAIVTVREGATMNTVRVAAQNPGRAHLDVEARDSLGNRISSMKIELSVPQFVHIFQAISEFDTVMNDFHLGVNRDDVVDEMRTTAEELLIFGNARMVWGVSPFSETLPSQLQSSMVTRLELLGDPPAGLPLALLGITEDRNGGSAANALVGPQHFDESIRVFARAMIDFNATDLGQTVVTALSSLVAQAPASTPERIRTIKAVGRVLGATVAHEIIHSLIGAAFGPPLLVHSSRPGDLLNEGHRFTFEQITGLDPNNFADLGVGAIARTEPGAGGSFDPLIAAFPVPPGFQ